MMTRDQVIECAKDWVNLLNCRSVDICSHKIQMGWNDTIREQNDVLNACIDLAFNRTKEALIAYAKERESEISAHERMLETIEATLQEGIKDV